LTGSEAAVMPPNSGLQPAAAGEILSCRG